MRDLAAAVATTRAEVLTLTAKLDALTARLEAAQRRADLSGLVEVVGWADAALLHLDARPGVACSLAELFHSVADSYPELTLAGFHQGLLKLAEVRAVRLTRRRPSGRPGVCRAGRRDRLPRRQPIMGIRLPGAGRVR